MMIVPALPIELKRLILELVAINDIDDARSLRLVSRDINVLVLPIVFRNLLVECSEDLIAFTTTIHPPPSLHHKLKNKKPDPPRLLSTYNILSLALLLPTDRPSIENALAAVGPVFSRLKYLAITSRGLSSNAFWLRDNDVRPTYIMLLHHGSPRPVNWCDPIFTEVTHMYTSSIDSHGYSTLCDLTNLTHLAVMTRADHLDDTIRRIGARLEWLLDPEALPNLQSLVLALSHFPRRPPPFAPLEEYQRYVGTMSRWRTHLSLCISSSKFFILPDPHSPEAEWESVIHGDAPDMWAAAASYRLKHPNTAIFISRERVFMSPWDRWRYTGPDGESIEVVETLPETDKKPRRRGWRSSKREWEIDLVQREGYRESERLDPQEAGEFGHVLSGF